MKEREAPQENHESKDKLLNGSITDYVLNLKGYENINQIPYEFRTDLVLVDLINMNDVSEEYYKEEIEKSYIRKDKNKVFKDLKIMLFGYRLWSHDPNFGLIKEFLPEGPLKWENIMDIIDDKGELGYFNNLLAQIDDITKELLIDIEKDGLSYIDRYKVMSGVVKRELVFYGDTKAVFENKSRIIEDFTLKATEYKKSLRRKKEKDKQAEELGIRYLEKEGYKYLRNRDLNDTQIKEILVLVDEGDTKSVVIMLRKWGFLQKEMAGLLECSEYKIERILRGLYYEGVIKPQPEHIEKNRRFIEMTKQVEILRKRGLTAKRIAEKLNVGEKRVRDAISVLISIDKIKPIDPKVAAKRRHRTLFYRGKVKRALRLYMRKNPGKSISFIELKELSRVPVSAGKVRDWCYEIARLEEVPLLVKDLKERAVERLLEIGRSNREPTSLKRISRRVNIPYKTVRKAYFEISDHQDAPVIILKEAELKKIQFLKAMKDHLKNYPNEPFNIRRFCREVDLNYTTGIRWYWEESEDGPVPRINSRWKKRPKV